MSGWLRDNWFSIILYGTLLSLIVGLSWLAIGNEIYRQNIYVEGELTGFDIVEEQNVIGIPSTYYVLTFDNNQSYKCHLDEEFYDFTVNSTLVMKLSKGGHESVWEIRNIIKIPSSIGGE